MAGGNSHQRKLQRKTEERIAQRAAELVEGGKAVVSLDRPNMESKPKGNSKADTIRAKVHTFWTSTPAWGAIGVLIGALVAQLSRQLLFVGVGIVLWLEAIRVGFFEVRLWKWLGNIALAAVIAMLLIGLWKIVPPKGVLTLDQQIQALAKSFPWLTKPVSESTKQTIPTAPPPAQAVVTCPGYSLKFTQKQIDTDIGPDPFRVSVEINPKRIPAKTLPVIKLYATGKITGGAGQGIMKEPGFGDPVAAGISVSTGHLGIRVYGNSVAELWLEDQDKFAKAKAVAVQLTGPERFSVNCVQWTPEGQPGGVLLRNGSGQTIPPGAPVKLAGP